MTQLKRFGFFADVPAGTRHVELERQIGTTEQECRAKLLAYLRGGLGLFVVPGIVRDQLDPKRAIIGAPHVLTDGVWAWTTDVAYYVENYNLRVPDEFVENMRRNDWRVPKVEDPQLLKL